MPRSNEEVLLSDELLNSLFPSPEALTKVDKIQREKLLNYFINNNCIKIVEQLLGLHRLSDYEIVELLKFSIASEKEVLITLFIDATPNKELADIYQIIINEPTLPLATKNLLDQRLGTITSIWVDFLTDLQMDFARYHKTKFLFFESAFYAQKEAFNTQVRALVSTLKEDPVVCCELKNQLAHLFSEFTSVLIAGRSKRYLNNICTFLRIDPAIDMSAIDFKDYITERVFHKEPLEPEISLKIS